MRRYPWAEWQRVAEDPKPPAAESRKSDIVAKVRAGLAARAENHEELVAVLRVLLRQGESARWSSIRRLLRLAGHQKTRTHHIILALLEVAPDAHLGRHPPRGRGPRAVFGVQLVADMETLRKRLSEKWEAKLEAEGLPREVLLTAMEYKLSPANDNGMGEGRLAELVRRVHDRKADASRYYSIAAEYLWRAGWNHYPGHKAVWALHCEGATKEEIAAETGLKETKVQSVLDFHRARAGLSHR